MTALAPSRVYLAPGMFGFATVASFVYFEHALSALRRRFERSGRKVELHVVEVHPTASIRRRAAKLAQMICDTASDDGGPIHLFGHSTGGLDARLVASPSVRLDGTAPAVRPWLDRLRSVTTVNTPHYGTPLAAFFATVSGQRMLYAVSALTVTALKVGSPPLAAASTLLAVFGRTQGGMFEVELLDRAVDGVVRVLDEASSRELRAWLQLLRDDQGAIIQLTPEPMDLFQAGIEDRPGVRYQSVATYARATRCATGSARCAHRGRGVGHDLHRALQLHSRTRALRVRTQRRVRQRAVLAMLESSRRSRPATGVPLYSRSGASCSGSASDHLDTLGHFPARTAQRLAGQRRALRQGALETVMDRGPADVLGRDGARGRARRLAARRRRPAHLRQQRRARRRPVSWRARHGSCWRSRRRSAPAARAHASSPGANRWPATSAAPTSTRRTGVDRPGFGDGKARIVVVGLAPARTAPTAPGACSPAIARATSSTPPARAGSPRSPRARRATTALAARRVHHRPLPLRTADNAPTLDELAPPPLFTRSWRCCRARVSSWPRQDRLRRADRSRAETHPRAERPPPFAHGVATRTAHPTGRGEVLRWRATTQPAEHPDRAADPGYVRRRRAARGGPRRGPLILTRRIHHGGKEAGLSPCLLAAVVIFSRLVDELLHSRTRRAR